MSDPFALSGGDKAWVPKKKAATVEEKYPPSIVERALKRIVFPRADSVGSYTVTKLDRELRNTYHVRLEAGKWVCDCYGSDHGETRQRKGCSHVVAVLLYRQRQHTPPRLEGIGSVPDLDDGTRVDIRPKVERVWTDEPPAPSSPAWKGHANAYGDLPKWVEEIRLHQWEAVRQIVDAFDDGADIVWLDAPTGAGKTLIAELVARVMGTPYWYVCNGKDLQDQFIRDFPYAKVLKGRSNYPTLDRPFPDYTAADCTKEGQGADANCYWCREVSSCPYEIAKREALKARCGVLNTSYLLAEANYIGWTGGKNARGLIVADEADVLEQMLMGFVTYELSERRLARLHIDAPKKGVRKKTILAWMEDELVPAIKTVLRELAYVDDVRGIRERNGFTQLLEDTYRVIQDLGEEVRLLADKGSDEEGEGIENWIRDNDAGPLVLKPVRVDAYGERALWRHGKKWLCMSASFISTSEMEDSLGVTAAGLKTATVKVPMLFPVENREIIAVPLANMTNREKAVEWPKALKAIETVCGWHDNVRVLIHTVSYQFTEYLEKNCGADLRRRLVVYRSGKDREAALARYRRTENAVLLAPSMERGIDLKGDECRVVIVAKVPFPNLGDRQVGSRLRGAGGQTWYNVQTIRKLVQMTGRGVRGMDDWCNIYIFDVQFVRKIWKNKMLLPDWWRESVSIGQVKDFQ